MKRSARPAASARRRSSSTRRSFAHQEKDHLRVRGADDSGQIEKALNVAKELEGADITDHQPVLAGAKRAWIWGSGGRGVKARWSTPLGTTWSLVGRDAVTHEVALEDFGDADHLVGAPDIEALQPAAQQG